MLDLSTGPSYLVIILFSRESPTVPNPISIAVSRSLLLELNPFLSFHGADENILLIKWYTLQELNLLFSWFEATHDSIITKGALKWSGQGESNPYRQIHSLRCFPIHHAPEKIAYIYTYAHFTD